MSVAVTLSDFKEHLNIAGANTSDDFELSETLAAALDVVAGITGSLDPVTEVTETHYGVSTGLVALRRAPALSISAVSAVSTRWLEPTSLTFTTGDVTLDQAAGLLRLTAGRRFQGDVTVTYTVGRSVVPAAVRLAVLIVAAHLWETQRGTAPGLNVLQGESTTDYQPGLGYAIPNRARELLAPYMNRSAVVA